MLKGIAAAATAMIPRIRAQEVIANNLANASTVGFKRDRVFERSLSEAQAAQSLPASDWQLAQVAGLAVDYGPGALDRTDNPLNIAIDGEGFLVVATSEGERYTRNGTLQLSPDGTLVTPDGDPVQGWGGSIQINPGTVAIAEDGTVTVDGLDVGQLRIVRFRDLSRLERTSSSLFAASDPLAGMEDDRDSIIRQGFIERSNVNTIEELVNMIATMRIYETDQKAIQAQDDTLGRAISDMGRVS